MSPYEMPTRNVMVSALPAMSMYPVSSGSRDSGTCFAEMIRMATAMGALMRNINRHDSAEIRNPPTHGPSAAATPPCEKKNHPQRRCRDQDPADERSQRGGDAAEPGPRADDATALFLGE